MKNNIYNIPENGSVIAYILDINGDVDLWDDDGPGFVYKLSSPTPKEVASLAHLLTCTKAYRGKRSIRTAHRRLFRLARKVCPDLFNEAIEQMKIFKGE